MEWPCDFLWNCDIVLELYEGEMTGGSLKMNFKGGGVRVHTSKRVVCFLSSCLLEC